LLLNIDDEKLLEKIIRKLEGIAVKVANNKVNLEELKQIFCNFLKKTKS
jgi:hypothetical protein